MTPINLRKFKNFQYFPDIAHKFLFETPGKIPSFKRFYAVFFYKFSSVYTFDGQGMKAILMLESIFPKRVQFYNRFYKIKFGSPHIYSFIELKLNFDELFQFFQYYVKKPMSLNKLKQNFLKQGKYFVFPGQIRHLWFSSWKPNINVRYEGYDNLFFFFINQLLLINMISLRQNSMKQKLLRRIYKENEIKRRFYKFLKLSAPKLGFFPLHSLRAVKIKNFCLVTGSARSIYSHMRLSRHQIKKQFDFVTGLRNSSW